MFQKRFISLSNDYIKPIGLAKPLRGSYMMSKNYLELQTHFKFLDPAEQPSIPVKNKVTINLNKTNVNSPSEFQSHHEDHFKVSPEL
jgi:hypothetical protein